MLERYIVFIRVNHTKIHISRLLLEPQNVLFNNKNSIELACLTPWSNVAIIKCLETVYKHVSQKCYTIVDMLGVMSGITDLKPLGHELDLDPAKLNELQQGGGGPEQHAEELLVLWQQKDGDPSWEKLARALKRMGEHEMSRKIVEKHVHNHSDGN